MNTELHQAMYCLLTFVNRANCGAVPTVILEFENVRDEAVFLATYKHMTTPVDVRSIPVDGRFMVLGVNIVARIKGEDQ